MLPAGDAHDPLGNPSPNGHRHMSGETARLPAMAASFIRLRLLQGVTANEISAASFRPDIIGACGHDIRNWFLRNFLLIGGLGWGL
jgi:hypothetical protein